MSPKQPKQVRSQETLERLTAAAIEVIADGGMAALTHRSLALRSGSSLATTTYYFPKKSDIVSSVSAAIMDGYISGFRAAGERYAEGRNTPSSIWEFSVRVIRSSVGKNRTAAMAWAEIYLDGIRRHESRHLVETWVQELQQAWEQIAKTVDPDMSVDEVRSNIDLVIGLTFMALGLGVTSEQVGKVLVDGEDPLVVWAQNNGTTVQAQTTPVHRRQGAKAARTKARVLDAAIKVLEHDGAAGLTHRRIATDTGLAGSAPAYYYPSITDLLRDAQMRLFDDSKTRYREALVELGREPWSLEWLADATAFILQREALSYGPETLAHYQIWIEAGRRVELRPMVWDSMANLTRAWNRVFEQINENLPTAPGMYAQALFVGKLIRVLSAGGNAAALVRVRGQFRSEVEKMATGTFPAR